MSLKRFLIRCCLELHFEIALYHLAGWENQLMSLYLFSWIQSNLKLIKKVDFIQCSCPGMRYLRLDSLDLYFFQTDSLFFINWDVIFVFGSILSHFNFALIFLCLGEYLNYAFSNFNIDCWYHQDCLLIGTQLSFSFFISILRDFVDFIKLNFLNQLIFSIFLLRTHCL